MQRAKRLFLAVISAVLLATASAAPLSVFALGATRVTLSCDDGTRVDVAVDAASLLNLKNAVEGTVLYPAGLTCGLAENGLVGVLGPQAAVAANGPKDFAVGGGQFTNQFIGCRENFAISAHVPADAPVTPGTAQPGAGGTVNLTFPGTCLAQGHLVTKVECVQVLSDIQAKFTSVVTKSTGFFANLFPVGTRLAWDVKDLDPLPDQFVGQPTSAPCVFTAESNPGTFSVERGNIEVHDN